MKRGVKSKTDKKKKTLRIDIFVYFLSKAKNRLKTDLRVVSLHFMRSLTVFFYVNRNVQFTYNSHASQKVALEALCK